MKSAHQKLYYQYQDSDKIYIVDLIQEGKLFSVAASYGKRGGKLQTHHKTDTPISYNEAKTIFDRLVHAKVKDGYKKSFKGTPKTLPKKIKEKTDKIFDQLQKLVLEEKDITAVLLNLSESERMAVSPLAMAFVKSQPDKNTNISFAYFCFYFCEDADTIYEKVEYHILDEKFHPFYKTNFSKLPAYLVQNIIQFSDNSKYIELVDKGVLDKNNPHVKRFLLTLLGLLPFEGYFASDREYAPKNLIKNPNTIQEHIYWLIEEKGYFSLLYGNNKTSDGWKKTSWIDIFLDLNSKKKLDANRIVKNVFKYYTPEQKPEELKEKEWENQMAWGYDLIKRLELGEKILLTYQAELIPLINSPTDKIVKLVLDIIKQFINSTDFDMASFLSVIENRIETIDPSVANKIFALFTHHLKINTKYKEQIIKVVTIAVRHKIKKVTEKANVFINKFGSKSEQSTAVQIAKPRVKKKNELSYENSSKIVRLLSSQGVADHQIAVQIINSQPFPEEIINEVFATYRMSQDEAIAKTCYELLKTHGSDALMKIIDERIPLGGRFPLANARLFEKEKALEKELKLLEKETELVAIKIVSIYILAYEKGQLFIANSKVSSVQKDLFQRLIKNNTFEMHLWVAKMPPALFHFPEVEVIDLSGNGIRSIPKEIAKLKNLRVLNLSKNSITKISDKIGTLSKLEILNLEHNDLKGTDAEQLPKSITNLTALKSLLLDKVGYHYDTKFPEYLTNFKHLTSFSNGVKYHKPYGNYPDVEKITGNPINMEYMALSFSALEQGQRIPIQYIFRKGTTEEIKRALDLIYDAKEKRLNLRMLNLTELPKELSNFDIEHLDLSLNELISFPRDIFQFKKLKTLSLSSAFKIKSDPITFTSADLKGFADFKKLESIVINSVLLRKHKEEIITLLPSDCQVSKY